MRPSRVLTKLALLGVGSGALALLLGKRLRPAPLPPWSAADDRDEAVPPVVMPAGIDIDPGDPVQGLDDVAAFHIEELDVDAHSIVEADEELGVMEAETLAESQAEEEDPALDVTAAQPTLDVIESSMHDVGDLYGGHTPPGMERVHPDDDQAMDEGQNWVESLQASSIEDGAVPEFELDDIVDDADIDEPPHPSDSRDRPVADRGSGGPGGV